MGSQSQIWLSNWTKSRTSYKNATGKVGPTSFCLLWCWHLLTLRLQKVPLHLNGLICKMGYCGRLNDVMHVSHLPEWPGTFAKLPLESLIKWVRVGPRIKNVSDFSSHFWWASRFRSWITAFVKCLAHIQCPSGAPTPFSFPISHLSFPLRHLGLWCCPLCIPEDNHRRKLI